MNCAAPTDVTFSFTGFAARGGVTDHHADGWGIAFFEDKACRLFIDHQSSATSPIAEMVKRYPIKSKNTMRHWIFAHNGDLKDYSPVLSGVYQPVGTTDSELAFCALLEGLRKTFPGAQQPPLNELFAALQTLTREITQFGVFNFLMSNGQALFAHCSTHLHYIVRRWPFSTAHLVDADVSIDFAKYTTPEDRVAVIATQPLTDNEVWTAFAPGDLLMFQHGDVIVRVNVPVPASVLEKLRNPALDASASASTIAASAAATPVVAELEVDLEAADDAAAFES